MPHKLGGTNFWPTPWMAMKSSDSYDMIAQIEGIEQYNPGRNVSCIHLRVIGRIRGQRTLVWKGWRCPLPEEGGGGRAPYNGLYEDVTPERVNFFTFPGFLKGKGYHQLMCIKGL